MSETMLTMIARMTVEETGFHWPSSPQSTWRATVTATVKAMREPSEAIRILAEDQGISVKDYQALIDLILSEAPWSRHTS